MKRQTIGSVLALVVGGFGFAGCNTILDNTPGTFVDSSEPGERDAGMSAPPQGSSSVDLPDASPTRDDAGDAACPIGRHMCFGACVSLTDPLYGCGDPSCRPCSSSHAAMTCQGRSCVVASCDSGYADCNRIASDGCEVDLSKPDTCGACNATCTAAAPVCAPSAATFACNTGCTPSAPLLCDAECADPNTSVNHCGSCNVACAAVANGSATCTSGVCGFTCKPGFHACGGRCVPRTDPSTCGPACVPCVPPTGGTATCPNDVCRATCPKNTHLCADKCVADNNATACGASCTACPVPANAQAASCTGGICGFTCNADHADCDKLAPTGCEVDIATDVLNCGACGKACTLGEVCAAGKCGPAPPPPPPPAPAAVQ